MPLGAETPLRIDVDLYWWRKSHRARLAFAAVGERDEAFEGNDVDVFEAAKVTCLAAIEELS